MFILFIPTFYLLPTHGAYSNSQRDRTPKRAEGPRAVRGDVTVSCCPRTLSVCKSITTYDNIELEEAIVCMSLVYKGVEIEIMTLGPW